MSFINEYGGPVDIHFEKEEQSLVRKYVPKNSTVLELGARYGTVSCVLSEILDDPTRHVAVEPDESVLQALECNKQSNGGKFHIFPGVVSKKKYEVVHPDIPYEFREYCTYTKESEMGKPGTTLEELQEKYGLQFDCIVADCEGFFCDFIDENPWILDQVHTIIFEKDGTPWSRMIPKYEALERTLVENKFTRAFSLPHIPPHAENNPHFHSVWIKDNVSTCSK
jgi:FkbM family methyltransferase